MHWRVMLHKSKKVAELEDNSMYVNAAEQVLRAGTSGTEQTCAGHFLYSDSFSARNALSSMFKFTETAT